MSKLEQRPSVATHEVTNQALPLVDYNSAASDRPLMEALEREGAGWARQLVLDTGEFAGSEEAIRWGFEANDNPPKLKTHDRFGNRIDEVEFHPAWHEMFAKGIELGLHSLPWTSQEPGAHVARTAMFMVFSQAEPGVGCPISMTYSGVPALRAQPEIADEWVPRLLSTTYDGRELRPATEKAGAVMGMAMTEKQGGSDVRANTTRATPLNGGGAGAEYSLVGHKWFCSAPMCDAFLTLAQTDEGVSCFLVPRFTPDGERNVFRIQRLKNKLGNRSNASSEIEYAGTWARMVGEPGRGVPTIIEMVAHTRLDCTSGSASGMRAGVAAATWHSAHRSAFGKQLADQPLMQNVLADLCVESEAATAGAMRLARAFDEAHGGDERATLFRRIATPVLKYWTCKRAPWHAVECLECHGGNGYVEESGMPRLFRESPLQSIWEGSGNVQALDALRAMAKSPDALGVFFDEVSEAGGSEPRLDAFVRETRREFEQLEDIEMRARRVVERMALALQGSLLLRHGDPAVADAFCASRLGGDWGGAFGTLPPGLEFERIIERHTPVV